MSTPTSLLGGGGRPRRDPAPPLRAGAWVEITEGAAAGARGWVCRCGSGQATIVALGLARLPLLLTVPAERCRPLRR